MEKFRKWLLTKSKSDRSVVWLMVQGYLLLTILCFLFLLLPISENGYNTVVDHLFFAVSIVSTTGLVPADFATSYSLFGQIVSLIFIQMGGVGYMALGSFIIIKNFKRLPNVSANLLHLEFNLPKKYPLMAFIYSVFFFTLIIEIIGAILLYIGFEAEGVAHPLWNAIFHSISAFCTAGFSLFGDSMVSFSDNWLITNTIMVLSLLGSVGFIVVVDFWLKFRKKRKTVTLTSKIIMLSIPVFGIASALFVFLSDANLFRQGFQGFQQALFQTISAHSTAGFNNIDVSGLSIASIFLLIIVMIIGASPSGTGGGIKTTSITAIFAVLKAILKKQQYITFLRKEIPASNIYLSVASAIFYLLIFTAGSWLLLLIENGHIPFQFIVFEAASALSTVGLSAGVTAQFSDASKIVLAVLMFMGRVGVLTFGFALIKKAPLIRSAPQMEDIAV